MEVRCVQARGLSGNPLPGLEERPTVAGRLQAKREAIRL